MGLAGAGLILRYIYNYRLCWIGGRYGGGKTSLAFRLAYELQQKFKFRYIISNVDSVWGDPIEEVVLEERGGALFADAILVLDEAGAFISSQSEAKEWLEFLRKLNVVLILPSVFPPYRDMRMLSIRRDVNWQSIGLPLWAYKARLQSGDDDETFKFSWWFPEEIIGIYDTLGYPTDAEEMLGMMKGWVKDAAQKRGYTKTAEKQRSKVTFGGSEASDAASIVADIGGEIDALSETAYQAKRALSTLERKTRGGRGRKS